MSVGKLAIITGPSGAGKDVVKDGFLARHADWVQPPSTTTRAPRAGEVDGKIYNFVDLPTFQRLRQENKFLEAYEVYKDLWYGTLREPVERLRSLGHNVLLRVDVQGALDIKKNIPEAITIMIQPESFAVLEQRMRRRASETPERAAERLEIAKKEMSMADQFDHLIINSTGGQDQSIAKLEEILTD